MGRLAILGFVISVVAVSIALRLGTPAQGQAIPFVCPDPRTPISSLPFAITEPGSYYLTKDLTGVAGQHGITIEANHVTIDLNGFAMGGIHGTLDGIRVDPSGDTKVQLAIFGGTIHSWRNYGIDLQNTRGCRLRDLNVSANGEDGNLEGVRLGLQGTMERCTIIDNRGCGVVTGEGCAVFECQIVDNHRDGLCLGPQSRAVGNLCEANGKSSGFSSGIFLSVTHSADGCHVEGNTVIDNDYGIRSGAGTSNNLVIGNRAHKNPNGAFFDESGNNAFGITLPVSGTFANTDPTANISY